MNKIVSFFHRFGKRCVGKICEGLRKERGYYCPHCAADLSSLTYPTLLSKKLVAFLDCPSCGKRMYWHRHDMGEGWTKHNPKDIVIITIICLLLFFLLSFYYGEEIISWLETLLTKSSLLVYYD